MKINIDKKLFLKIIIFDIFFVFIVSFIMWFALPTSSAYRTSQAHSIILMFPILFVSAIYLSWYSVFVKKRLVISWLYLLSVMTVPFWGWSLLIQMWKFIKGIIE
jgi:hypothetical protein